MSVNVSVRQFQHPDLVDHVTEALRVSGLDPRQLTLEITESLFAEDTNATTEKLEQLKLLGVQLALDDFGTGYSSLSYLRRFPIDILKIDKSFVDGVATNAEDRAVIGAIVQLGQTLRLALVAEGIETSETLAALEALGVHYGQGYHLGRPAAPPVDPLALQTAERRRPSSPGSSMRVAPESRGAVDVLAGEQPDVREAGVPA